MHPSIFESWFLSRTFEVNGSQSHQSFIYMIAVFYDSWLISLKFRDSQVLKVSRIYYCKFSAQLVFVRFPSSLLCFLLRSSRVSSCWCPVQARSVVLLVRKRELYVTQQRIETKWGQLGNEYLFSSLRQDWNHFSKYLTTIQQPLTDKSRRKL